jgi:hypothetical protein
MPLDYLFCRRHLFQADIVRSDPLNEGRGRGRRCHRHHVRRGRWRVEIEHDRAQARHVCVPLLLLVRVVADCPLSFLMPFSFTNFSPSCHPLHRRRTRHTVRMTTLTPCRSISSRPSAICYVSLLFLARAAVTALPPSRSPCMKQASRFHVGPDESPFAHTQVGP